MFTLSFTQEPIKPIKPVDTENLQKPIPISKAERVTNCVAKLTIETQISADWLRRSIHVDARATNMNNVKVTIYHSFVQGNNLKCSNIRAAMETSPISYMSIHAGMHGETRLEDMSTAIYVLNKSYIRTVLSLVTATTEPSSKAHIFDDNYHL